MDRPKVFCPWCQHAGDRSTVRSVQIMTRQGKYDHYYDEDGNYHRHSGDVTVESFICARGHQWKEKWSPPCFSCDFQQQPRVVVK